MEPFKVCKCKYCGKSILVNLRDDGKGYKERTVCDDCAKPQPFKTKECVKCGKTFKVKHLKKGYERKTLCPECSKPAKTKICKCEKCGKEFTVEREDVTKQFPNRKFCDDCSEPVKTKNIVCKKCGKEFTVERDLKNNQFSTRSLCLECSKPIDYIIKTCKKCGKEFKIYRSQNGYISYNKLYCEDCSKRETIEKTCEICGEKFLCYKSESWRKTCSKQSCIIKLSEQNRIKTCQEKYGVDYACLLPQVIKSNKLMHSKINKKFGELLSSNNIKFKDDFRIGNYAYDFYLWGTYTLVEINPTFTHTTAITGVFEPRDKNYHLDKTRYAQEHSYRCIHVWQWDDWDKIINLIKPKQRLYARKLQLKEISKQETNKFLDKYHIQNSCYGNSVNLGLYQDEELVQIMTFGKPRYNKNYQWELLRLCTHSDYIVVGGAEKLFKHFVEQCNPESIISYCDMSKFTGDVYERLGFKQMTKPQPREHWSNKNTKEHITAVLLLQKGYDNLFNTNYGKGTDNRKLMLEHNWLPIFDCGQVNYVWTDI